MLEDNEGTISTLASAAADGRKEECERLIAEGQDVNSINDLGWTPLMQAVRNGHCELARFLISRNADVCIRNHHGVTAFVLAVPHCDEELLNTLYNCLRDTELREAESTSALQLACLGGSLSTASWLLTYTASQVNMVSPITGVTPLLLAVMGGHHNLVELLLSFGADKSICSTLGQDVFQLALFSKNRKLLQLLQENSPKLTGCFNIKVTKPDNKSIDALYTTNNIHLNLQGDCDTVFKNSSSHPVFKICDDDSEGCRSTMDLSPSLTSVFLPSPQRSNSPLSSSWDCNSVHLKYNVPGLISPRHFTPKSLNGVKRKKMISYPSWLKRLTKRRCRSLGADENTNFNNTKPTGFDFSQLLFVLGLDEFYSIFKDQELDMGTFLTLTVEDLEAMGIYCQTSQDRILQGINMLKKIQL